MNIDQTTEFGARVARRLAVDEVIWLTTVAPSGRPLPSPVWFLWDDGRFLVYSQPSTPKLRNIALNQWVSLHCNCSVDGDDVIVFAGVASLDPEQPPADEATAYLTKYRAAIGRIGMTPASFAAAYSVAIWVAPTGVRGH